MWMIMVVVRIMNYQVIQEGTGYLHLITILMGLKDQNNIWMIKTGGNKL